MAYAKTSERREKRLLRDQMRSMGLGYRDIAAEFARRYRLRPRAAWRDAYGWSLQDTADRINDFRGNTGLDPGGIASMTAPHLSEYERWPGHGPEPGRRPNPYLLAVLAAVYDCAVTDLIDLADREHLPPGDLLILDKYTQRPAPPHSDNQRVPQTPDAPGREAQEHDAAGSGAEAVKTAPNPDANRVLEHTSGFPVRELPRSTGITGNENRPNGGEDDSVPSLAMPAADDVADVLIRVQKIYRSTVHPGIIRHLQDSTRDTVEQYENLDHTSLVPALRKQRAWIESLIDECGHPTQRRQLYEIAGITSGVLGYVAVGGGYFPLARAYCLEAFQLGEFAGDSNLQAWARGLQSFSEYYAGHFDEALTLANDGLGYAQSGPQSVRLKINGAARALAKLGDVKGVDRAVEEAHDLMSVNDVPDGVPSSIALGCYSAAQTASNAATAYVSLAVPEKVEHYANLALPEISKSDSPWSRSLVLIDVATSHLCTKEADLDHASTLVRDALTISTGRPVISVQQRASEFVRDVIDRWGDVPQSRTIRDAITALSE